MKISIINILLSVSSESRTQDRDRSREIVRNKINLDDVSSIEMLEDTSVNPELSPTLNATSVSCFQVDT